MDSQPKALINFTKIHFVFKNYAVLTGRERRFVRIAVHIQDVRNNDYLDPENIGGGLPRGRASYPVRK